MQEFGENFDENSRGLSNVILDHVLWGKQIFECEHLQIINDDLRKGVVIKGNDIYVFKKNIILETDDQVSDGRFTITVNKL